MAGGSLTLTVDTYGQLAAAAQRVLCWSTNDGLITTTTSAGGIGTAIVVPEAAFGVGSLVLKRGGTDLVAGYVAGTNISAHAGNAASIEQDPNLCPASTNQPTITTVLTSVGGNPRAITVNYANVAAAGTVNIYWGDGTSTLGAAESGAASHTYSPTTAYFGARIRIEDASVTTNFAEFIVKFPQP
jgi:hypothetical protein